MIFSQTRKPVRETDTAIPGRTLLLILLAFVASLSAHVIYLPLWFWGSAVLVLGWRAGVWLGYLHFPRLPLRILVLLLVTGSVVVATDATLSLESSTAFLLATAFLKLLELARRRDAIVLILLTLFIQATGFLYSQGILITLNGIITVWLASAAMLSVQATHRRGVPQDLPVFRQAAWLMVMALPLMLAAYLLFPRLGPLWSVPLQTQSAFTGLSHSMSPGDISSLSESDDLAFRVVFDGQRPPRSSLYWRALVLSDYDGRAWHSRDQKRLLNMPAQQTYPGEALYRYDVIAEPTGQSFLFSLAGVRGGTQGTGLTTEGLLASSRSLMQRFRYQAVSVVDEEPYRLTAEALRRYRLLPPEGNPQVREWAADVAQQNPRAGDFAAAVMAFFANENFVYTLKPPVYGRDDIDELMFQGQRGFCAHFAAAMVFAARSAGFPARIITGYQGGEWSDEGYLSVRQYDAHAWAEIWTGEGWQRFDPTAVIAPERIRTGLEEALAEEGSFLQQNLLSPHRYRHVQWLNTLRQRMENLNYQWTRWVLSYDSQRQLNLLRNHFGIEDITRAVYWLAAALVITMVIASLVLWWSQRPKAKDPLLIEWQALRSQVRRLGMESVDGESPLTLLRRVAQAFPALANEAEAARTLTEQRLYATANTEAEEVRPLILSLKQLRRLLAKTPTRSS